MNHVPIRDYIDQRFEDFKTHVDAQFAALRRELRGYPTWPRIIMVVIAIVSLALGGYAVFGG